MKYNPAIVPLSVTPKRISYDWNDVYFLAQSIGEEFSTVRIISLCSYTMNCINEDAVQRVLIKYPNWGYVSNKRAENLLRKTEREMVYAKEHYARECIKVQEDGSLMVVIDVEDVTSDEAIERTLQLISMYTDYGNDQFFGLPKKIPTSFFEKTLVALDEVDE